MHKSTIRVLGLCLIGAASVAATVYSSATYACDGLANPTTCNADAAKPIPVANLAQLTDDEIAYIYLQANQFDVEEAELGAVRGTASGVKQHGEMVAKDHRGVVVAFQGILTQNNIEPVAPADDSATVQHHLAVMKDLRARSGADFDREYLTQAIIGHRAFIELVSQTLLPAARNPSLASHLKAVLPAFKQHLAMTMTAAKSLGSDKD